MQITSLSFLKEYGRNACRHDHAVLFMHQAGQSGFTDAQTGSTASRVRPGTEGNHDSHGINVDKSGSIRGCRRKKWGGKAIREAV
jgi:hypothetical protein